MQDLSFKDFRLRPQSENKRGGAGGGAANTAPKMP